MELSSVFFVAYAPEPNEGHDRNIRWSREILARSGRKIYLDSSMVRIEEYGRQFFYPLSAVARVDAMSVVEPRKITRPKGRSRAS